MYVLWYISHYIYGDWGSGAWVSWAWLIEFEVSSISGEKAWVPVEKEVESSRPTEKTMEQIDVVTYYRPKSSCHSLYLAQMQRIWKNFTAVCNDKWILTTAC